MNVLDIDTLLSNYAEDIIFVKKFITYNYCVPNPDALQFREVDGEVVVDYDGYLKCKNLNIESLTNGKFRFGNVSSFDCSGCKNLTLLKGAPVKCDKFYCSECDRLVSLEGAPRDCNVFSCFCCIGLKSLNGAPNTKERFNCEFCYELT